MKRKLAMTLLTLTLALCSIFSLTACGGNNDNGNSDNPPHIHEFTTLKYDTTNHWFECECGDKKDIETHKGGLATETSKAVCEICNQEYGSVLGHSHTFTEQVVQDIYLKEKAKCESKAKYYFSCYCGEMGTETFESGVAQGHSFTNYKSDNNATCEVDGTKTAVCNRNGCNETDTITDVNSKLGHSFTNYKSDNNATCEVDGTKTAVCNRNGCNETDTIIDDNSKLGHSFTNYISDNNATCEKDGTKTAVCNRNGCNETDTIIDDNSKLGHSFTNYISDNNATYEVDGTKTAVCNRNGCNETDTIIDEGSKLIPNEGLEYELNSDGQSYSVTGIGTCEDTNIIIPLTYENKPVTSIGDWAFSDCTSLTSIEIPISVKEIREGAFESCTSLTSVVIPDSVKSIDEYAFYSCDSLTSVVIGNSVTSIGDYAFEWCYKLVEVINKSSHITVTKSTSNGYLGYFALAIYNSGDTFTGTKLSNDNGYIVYTEGSEKILVAYNGSQTNLTIPNYITKIYHYAFFDCDSLTSIEIPNSVISIGVDAFHSCDSLTSVVIGDSVTSIGDYAFSSCTSLTSIKYRGSQAQWSTISKDTYWNSNTGNYTITYNYTGE